MRVTKKVTRAKAPTKAQVADLLNETRSTLSTAQEANEILVQARKVAEDETAEIREEKDRLVDALTREARFHLLRVAELKDFLDGFGVSLD